MKLTDTFSLEPFVKSDTASRLKIDNTPSAEVEAKLRDLYENLLKPLMDMLPGEFNVTSGFRCNKLNAAVKGKPTSQHVKGEAADIEYREGGVENNMTLYNKVVSSGLEFDQCIKEYPDRTGNPRWIHLSYRKGNNRNMKLTVA